jgi:hypothetical protein
MTGSPLGAGVATGVPVGELSDVAPAIAAPPDLLASR